MVVFLFLLVIAMGLLAVFAVQNSATESFSFLNFHWSGVPLWLPPVIAGGGVAVLLLLYMTYSGARHGLRHRGLRRQMGTHEQLIAELQAENQRLRTELGARGTSPIR